MKKMHIKLAFFAVFSALSSLGKSEIDLLRKKLFGTSSEKRTIDIPGQLNFFNEAELEQNPEAVKAEDLEALLPEKTAKKRKARATDAERFKGVPVEKKYLELSEEEKLCPSCGTPLKEIGEEFVRRELVFVPAKLKVYEYYSKNYECPQCKLQDIPVIKKGKDGRAHMLYGMASAGTVAWVMYQKFCNGLPYYRQEKDWKQYGVEITRATMANWVIRNSEAFFLPMYEYFHRKLLERGFAMADETPLQVLHEPERRAQTKSYMWLFRSGEDGGIPIILYKYSETRAGDNAVDFLHGFKGYLMCDGYSGYNKVPDAKRTACWAHIRRYLADAIPKGKALDYTLPSVQGMLYINQLFHLEDVIRSKYSSFDAIKKARLEKETNGAQASAVVYTMVEMAKANGVNVYHYLTYLLEKVPNDRMSDDELELLAPWNETVKAEIEHRVNESNQLYVNCQGAPATEK